MTTLSLKAIRRHIAAAQGYLELDMPTHALAELELIGQTECYRAARSFLEGEAQRVLGHYELAVKPLRRATELLPIDHIFAQQAWISLSECFRETGQTELAQVAELAAQAVDELNPRQAAQAAAEDTPPAWIPNQPRFRD